MANKKRSYDYDEEDYFPKKRKKKKKGNFFFGMIKTLVLWAIIFVLAIFCVFKFYLAIQPPIKNLEGFKPSPVTQVYSADGELIKTFTTYKYEDTDIKDVPQDLLNALIATEDKNFYKHNGYDLFGLVRSTYANFKAGKIVQGASTITQQLARMLFLTNEKSFNRKFKEVVISVRIEKTLEKSKILEMYLNNVYLGSGAYGASAAASVYFNKDLKDLTLPECALIAGLPQAPSVYSPFVNPKLALERRNQVLFRMYTMKYITKERYEEAKNTPVKTNPTTKFNSMNKAPYFVDYVMKELEALGFEENEIVGGGYKITTTLNYKAQKAAEEAIRKNLAAWGLTGKKNQAAVFAFSPVDGNILVYIGGKNYEESQYDRVTQAIRPPGSSFKPFVYVAAVNNGREPGDMIEDTPVRLGGWTPKNYGDKYRGKIPLYKALAISSNVAAVRLIEEVGIREVRSNAREMGITTPLEYDYTISLGSNGVKLYDMAVAYGCFANGGYRTEPFSVLKVETSRGKEIYTSSKAKSFKVLRYETAGTVSAMLEQVIKAGTGRAADIDSPQGGKTGTTDNCKDAWFIGYTPAISAGVWVGNDDNSMLPGLTGGTVPAKIWHDMMVVANEPYKNLQFDYPEVDLKSTSSGDKNYEYGNYSQNDKSDDDADAENPNPSKMLEEFPDKSKFDINTDVKHELRPAEPEKEEMTLAPSSSAESKSQIPPIPVPVRPAASSQGQSQNSDNTFTPAEPVRGRFY